MGGGGEHAKLHSGIAKPFWEAEGYWRTPSPPNPALLAKGRAVMHTLASFLLPLLSQKPDMKCTGAPHILKACALTGYGWVEQQQQQQQQPGGAGTQELPLAAAALAILQADGCAEVKFIHVRQAHTLWWALHQVPDSAPQLQAAAAQVLTVFGDSLLTRFRNKGSRSIPDCSILLYTCSLDGCAHNSYYMCPRELLQLLEASVVNRRDGTDGDLWRSIVALQQLREAGAYTPAEESIRRLTEEYENLVYASVALLFSARTGIPGGAKPLTGASC